MKSIKVQTLSAIFRGLDVRGGRKLRTDAHTYTLTLDNYSNPRCVHALRACAPRVNKYRQTAGEPENDAGFLKVMIIGQLRISGGILMGTKIGCDVTSTLLLGPQFCMDCLWEYDFVSVPAP